MAKTKTVVRNNESLDSALKRFKKNVSRSGTLAEAKRREYYDKPSEIKKKQKKERNKK